MRRSTEIGAALPSTPTPAASPWMQEDRFALDSPPEGDGFEPSVPRDRPELSNTPKPNECRYFRRSDRHSGVRTWPIATGNQWFESISLQRRVSNELFWRWASMGLLPGRLRPELCGCWRKIADQGRIMTKQLASAIPELIDSLPGFGQGHSCQRRSAIIKVFERMVGVTIGWDD